jgi:hypothetical protein
MFGPPTTSDCAAQLGDMSFVHGYLGFAHGLSRKGTVTTATAGLGERLPGEIAESDAVASIIVTQNIPIVERINGPETTFILSEVECAHPGGRRRSRDDYEERLESKTERLREPLRPKTTMAQAHCLSHRGELWALGKIHRVAASAQAFPLMLPSRERPLELPGRPGHLGDSIVTPYMECANPTFGSRNASLRERMR